MSLSIVWVIDVLSVCMWILLEMPNGALYGGKKTLGLNDMKFI